MRDTTTQSSANLTQSTLRTLLRGLEEQELFEKARAILCEAFANRFYIWSKVESKQAIVPRNDCPACK